MQDQIITSEETEDQFHIKKVFSQLKPICTLISTYSQVNDYSGSSGDQLSDALDKLSHLIEQLSHDQMDRIAICKCFSYITFPLLLLCEKDYLLFVNRKKMMMTTTTQATSTAISRGIPLKIIERVVECFKVLFQSVDELVIALNDDQLMKFMALFQSMFIVYASYDSDEQASMMNNDSSSSNIENNSVFYSTEEIKHILVSCFRSLVELHILKKRNELLSRVQLQPLAALFLSKIIDILMNEKSTRLREECLITIAVLVKAVNNVDVLTSVFPGIVSSLFKLLYTLPGITMSKDGITPSNRPANRTKLSQGVICESFKTFRVILELVCSNERNQQVLTSEKDESRHSHISEQMNQTEYNLVLQNLRTSNNTNTDEKTTITNQIRKLQNMRKHVDSFLQRIFSAENYAHLKSPQTRIELVRTCQLILEKCDQTLWMSVPRTIECIMISANDESAPANSYADIANEVFSQYQQSMYFSDARIQGLIMERFSSLIHSLPNSCMLNVNEDEKRAVFILAGSYIRLVLPHNNLRKILEASDSMIEKISYALFIVFELDYTTYSKIIEESISSANSHADIYDYPKRIMKHFRDESTLRAAVSICWNIGKYSTIETFNLFVHHLRQLINQYSNNERKAPPSSIIASFHKECVLILQYIIMGFAEKIETNSDPCSEERYVLMDIIDELFMDYFDERLWNTAIVQDNVSVELTQNNALLTCLLLESVGTFFEVLNRVHPNEQTWHQSTRNSYLLRALFHILEHIGGPYQHVVHSALLTLDRIAKTDSYDNQTQRQRVTNLIVLNSDYIIDEIRKRMKYLNLYPSTPRLLRTMFDYAALRESYISDDEMNDTSIVTVMQDTLDSIFSALDDYHLSTTYSHSFMPVFFSILSSVVHVVVERKKRYDRKTKNEMKDAPPANTSPIVEDDENDYQSEDETDSNMENNYEEEDGIQHPDYILRERDLVQQILGRCKNFITMNDIHIQIHIIDILKNSLGVFMNDDTLDDKALPLVHSIWPSILSRVMSNSERIPVQQKVLDLMEHLIKYCDDFMYGKVIEDIWPRIQSHPLLQRDNTPGIIHNKACLKYLNTLEQHNQRTKHQRELLACDPYSYVRTTPEYKLHVSLLHFIHALTEDTSNVFMRRLSTGGTKQCLHAYAICDLVLPLLDHRLPNDMQTLAQKIIHSISKVDYASVWLSFMNYHSQNSVSPKAAILTPPEHNLGLLTFPKGNNQKSASAVVIDQQMQSQFINV